jgi:hypothetical protein
MGRGGPIPRLRRNRGVEPASVTELHVDQHRVRITRHHTRDAAGLGQLRSSSRKSRPTAEKYDKRSPARLPTPPGAAPAGTLRSINSDLTGRRGARFDLPHAVGFEPVSGAAATR